MKSNNSETTISQQDKRSIVGKQLSDTGVVTLTDWVNQNKFPAPIITAPTYLETRKTEYFYPTISKSEIILIDTLARTTYDKLKTIKNDNEIKEIKKTLTNVIEKLDVYQKETDVKDIAKCLEVIARTFQVSLPKDLGLELYIETLKELPAPLFKEALVEIVKTHRYHTFPLPANIIKCVDKKWDDVKAFYSWCKLALSKVASIV